MFLSRLLDPLIGIVTEDYLDNEMVHVMVCDLIVGMIKNFKNFQIFPVLSQLVALLLELLENSFKTVKAKVCICFSTLTKLVPVELQYFSKEILECLVHCLKHPDFNVRSSSLEALGSFGSIFSSTNFNFMFDYILGKKTENCFKILEFNQENILSTVLRDEDSQVRKKFFNVITEWLTLLPYKQDLKANLIPFLLIGLFDPISEVRETCLDLVISLEHFDSSGENEENETETGLEGFYSWHPFKHRTRPAVRQYFLQYYLELYPCLLKELNNFMSLYKETAARLLFVLMILTEHVNNENVENILVGLMSAVDLNESENVKKIIFQCLELIGRFIPARLYMWILGKVKVKVPVYYKFLCIPVKTVPANSQLTALSCLLMGSLGKLDSELEQSLPGILKFVKKFERSKYTFQICQILIESSLSLSEKCKSGIFKLLIEHENDSVSKLIKKVQESWYQLDLTHFNNTIQNLIEKISSLSSSNWQSLNLHVIPKQWPIFQNLCKHCRDFIILPNLFSIFSKILYSNNSPYHIPCLRIMRILSYHSAEVVNSLISKCLLGSIKTSDKSLLRAEALQLLKQSEHHNVEMNLFEALSACLDDSQLNVKLDACDEIHRQFTFVKIYGVEKFTHAKDQSNIVTKLMLKLICILEKEDNSMLNCLYPLIDVIGLFPEEIDINANAWSLVLKRLVKIVMDEDGTNMACKELAHLCIIAVTNSGKSVIIDELNGIANVSDKKTSDYIISMLSSD